MHTFSLDSIVRTYKVHILIFLIALITAITLAHPSIFVTDEWITINQLAQIQEGHQVIFNEGKYVPDANSTYAGYFTQKNNYLAYPLILPVISLPALWVVNGIDRFFILCTLYFWTFLLIAIALFMNAYFPDKIYVGKYRWTSGLIVAAFILFFANLIFNRPFSVTGNDAFPEVMAVVLTNIFLFSLMAVTIYEINRSVFRDLGYSIFGALVCISCTSYLFWANYCKDHLLVAFLFVMLALFVVKYLSEKNMYYLFGSFFMTGLLAWARPELALFVFAVLCIFVIYIYAIMRTQFPTVVSVVSIFTAPFFTLVGAIPFFINNYLFTGNIFIPAWIFWHQSASIPDAAVSGTISAQHVSTDTVGSLIRLFLASSNLKSETFFTDLYGVLFNPQSGSMGVFPVVPLFLMALFLIPVLWILGQWKCSREEKHLLAAMSLLAAGVFIAYVRGISGMNVSIGIVPDMRYLSPIYLPLNIIGLLVIRKVSFVSEDPRSIVHGIICSWIIFIPISVFLVVVFYPGPELFVDLFGPLNIITTLAIFILVTLCLISIMSTVSFHLPEIFAKTILAFVCAIPLIWQVDLSFLVRLFGTGLGGYSFIIPVIRTILLFHFI